MNPIENNNLKNYALMCECAEHVATFGILTDFLRRAVTDFYSYKSKHEELPIDDMKLLEEKFHELQTFFEKIITQIE